MKVLIVGVTGMIGSHLVEFLTTRPGVDVFGFKRWRSSLENLGPLAEKINLLEGDLGDPYSIQQAVESSQPDRIFHLAAQSYPSESWQAPVATFDTNAIGTIHLLEATRKFAPKAQVMIACSSAEYGLISPDEVPITEGHPLRPISPYGVSKVAQELLGLQYHLCFAMPIYLARFFNQVGPRQADRCSIQTFARQVAEIEQSGEPGVVRHGNLSPKRDFLDVRDGVRAIWQMLERGRPGKAYNVCSGQARQMRRILDELIRLSPAEIETEVDPRRLRPLDEPVIVGDASSLTLDTDWFPAIPFSQTLTDILDFWRQRIRVGMPSNGNHISGWDAVC